MNSPSSPATPATPASPAAVSGPAFSQLPLSEAMQANLQTLGYVAMTPIQAASLPLALAGKDLIAQASTGSGLRRMVRRPSRAASTGRTDI